MPGSDRVLIRREKYLKLMMKSVDSHSIKVLVGMRRTGKSTIMRMFIDDLISSGIDEKNIYYRSFDNELDRELPDLRGLIDDVKERIDVSPGKFILLDEMQDIDGWERAASSFFSSGANVYITGSNSNLLSSQLASKLSGRYTEINVYPPSFAEYVDFKRAVGDKSDVEDLLNEFLRTGSLPDIALMSEKNNDLKQMMLTGIFNTVYVKDVIRRNNIRNEPLMGNLNRFLLKNIGDRTSIRSATRYLNSSGYKTVPETIDSYIGMLESAILFYRSKRMDSKTKGYLVTSEKIYSTDLGIRNAIIGMRPDDIEGLLENAVFMELRKRYDDVSTYDVDGKEVDFVVWTSSYKAYYQVSTDISDADTLKRELEPLKAIDDNYPKYLITLSNHFLKDADGINIVRFKDWLLEG